MLASAIIVFREILEIALIMGVIAVATKGIPGRGKWILAGLAASILGSGAVAFFANEISMAAEGLGQEMFNAIILFSASLLIAWTVLWMATHARQLSQHIKNIGQKISDGSLPMYSLAAVIAITGLREGSEIILFLHGILASGTSSSAIMLGSLIGFAGGATTGALLYFGLIQIPTRNIFAVTSWLLIFLAAGMAANGAKYLVAADVLTVWTSTAWDSSAILSQDGLVGQVLHALFGYADRPMGIQIAFYIATVAILAMAIKLQKSMKKKQVIEQKEAHTIEMQASSSI